MYKKLQKKNAFSKERLKIFVFPQAGIECGDTLDDMLGIVLHKAKTAKVGNQMHVSLSLG